MSGRADPSAPPDPLHDSLFADEDALPAGAATRKRGDVPIAPAAPSDALRLLGRHLSPRVHLGTSSWSFAGWRGLVYADSYGESPLSRNGLGAYAQHPVLRAVGIDRSFYQPLPQRDFARYAAQVPEHFRFLVKAPALIADAVLRGDGGLPAGPNTHFLDAELAREQFVEPALRGLGTHAGPLVFQLSPLPRAMATGEQALALIERIGAF
ncbi:MAG: DUF72 domain-containing protein, partial [Burkholderiaceae bacterium]|nr:DUF72 domain-containing protein [Burkholderiaceae bacterium]